jgi:hypothetical protein
MGVLGEERARPGAGVNGGAEERMGVGLVLLKLWASSRS